MKASRSGRAMAGLIVGLMAIASSGASAADGDLTGIKSVYLLPMSGSLDQYLAIRLSNATVLEVVTDPKKADAVITDRIGPNFEAKLDELYAPPKPPAKDGQDDYTPPVMAPLSRGKGSVFLVNRKTRVVVWSTYLLPKGTGAREMNKVAEKVAERLERDLKKP